MKLIAAAIIFAVLIVIPANAKSAKKIACSKEDIIKAVQKDFSAKDPIDVDFDQNEVRFEAADYLNKTNSRSTRCKFRCESDSKFPVTLHKCNI